LHWLEEELILAQPRLVITLGAEVAGILQEMKGQRKRNALLGGVLKELQLGTASYQVIHLAHPGIVMRPASERNPWPRLHWETHIPAAREVVEQLAVG
jgi:uracil-DNA glycosylase